MGWFMYFFRVASVFGALPALISLLFCQSAIADNTSFVSDVGDKLLGDPYFYNQQCIEHSFDSIFCLKDYFYGKNDWYPVGIITVGQKPEVVSKLVNGMESRAGVVLGTYEFNKLIYDKKAVDIAFVSADRKEFGVFNLSYLMSKAGMCKSLSSLESQELFHYEDSGCNTSGSDYSFFGVHATKGKKNNVEKKVNGFFDEKVYKKGFYLLSNSGGKIIGYRMPNGFSDNGKFYIMIR